MNSGYYNGIAGLLVAERTQEIVANNLANSATAGFKAQRPFVDALNQVMAGAPGSAPRIGGSVVDFSPGAMRETRDPLDLALEGNALLVVETPDGERYTRDGRLAIEAGSGQLVTQSGNPVLGESGPLTLGPGKVEIAEDGRVLVDGIESGRLKLVAAETPADLRPEGAGLYRTPNPLAVAEGARVRPGFVEMGNVDPVRGTVALIEALRNFEAIAKASQLLMGDMAKALYEESGRTLPR